LAAPFAVTIQVYDASGVNLLYSNTSAATLTDGAATFTLAYALTPGTSYVLKAQATDLAGNVGASAAAAISVVSSIWSLNTTQALTSDPLQGDALLQLGNVHREHALDLGQSSDLALLQVNASASADATQARAEVDVSLTPLQSPTTPASLVYNSDSVSVRPIIQATLSSANNAPLPSQITAILTWNGGSPTTFTYSTASSNAGDGLTIAAQVPYAVMATGRYAWRLEVIAGTLDQTVSGSTFVVANDNSPFGAGWTFGPTDHLVNIPADPANGLPAGILRVYGNGGYRFYSGASFTSPANDSGALTASGGGYVYTDSDGARKTFDANGRPIGKHATMRPTALRPRRPLAGVPWGR
jgi:hypothetical protein